MVVVPTSSHVTLTYGYTTVDWLAFMLSLVGLLGLVVLWRRPALAYPQPRHLAFGDKIYPGPSASGH